MAIVLFSGAVDAGGEFRLAVLESPVWLAGEVETDAEFSAAFRPLVQFQGSVEADVAFAAQLGIGRLLAGAVDAEAEFAGALAIVRVLAGSVEADGEFAAAGFGGGRVELAGAVEADGELSAAMVVAIRFAGEVEVEGEASAGFAAVLPRPRPPRAWETAGTVNLVRNPSAEVDLTDWAAIGGAAINQDGTRAFDGVKSIRADLPGLGADKGLLVGTVRGLAYAGVEAVAFAPIYLSGTVSGMTAWVRGFYADGGWTDGERTDPFELAHDGRPGGWLRCLPPAYFTDPGRLLVYAECRVARAVAAGPAAFWADAAQIEEDRGQGATAFAIGSYGSDLGRWAGAEHLSPSVRQPIAVRLRTPAEAGTGGDGRVRVEGTIWRTTWDGVRLDEVAGVLDCSITMAPSRDVCFSLSATLTLDGWVGLTPYLDWVAPVMTVTLPDGTVREGQLGHYLVLDAAEGRGERAGTVELDARDPLWLLKSQALNQSPRFPFRVAEGSNLGRSLADLLNGSLLTADGKGRPRYRLPDSDKRLSRRKEWEGGTPRLDWANEIARRALWYPLRTDSVGVNTTSRRGRDRLRRARPVRLWAAHLPPGADVDRRLLRPSGGLPTEVVGNVSVTPRAGERYDQILLTTDDPHGRRGHARGRIIRPHDPKVALGRGQDRRVGRVPWPILDSDSDAQEVAEALAEEAGTRESGISLGVVPDPSIEYGRETCALGIWDTQGREVAVGKFAIREVSWSFEAGAGGAQSMELGRIGRFDVVNGDDDIGNEAAA